MNCFIRPFLALAVAGLLASFPTAPSAWGQSLDDLGDVFDDQGSANRPQSNSTDETFDPFGSGDIGQPSDQQQTMTEEEAQQYFESRMDEAATLRADGKPAEAIAIYTHLAQSFPNAAFVPNFERAKTYAEMKEYTFALHMLGELSDSAFSLPPQFLNQIVMERGKLLMTMQDYEAALNDLGTAIQNDPGSAELQMLRGKALVRMGQSEGIQGLATVRQALSSLDQAIQLDESYAEAYAERALAQVSLQEYNRGVTDIERAVELQPDNTNFLARKGIILSRRAENERNHHDSDLDKVVEDLTTAIDSFNAYLAREGNKTREEFKDAPPETVTPDIIYSEKAAAEMKLGTESDPEEARRLYQMAIDDANASLKYQERSWVPVYQRGLAERMLGDLHEAIDSFTHALKLSPAPNGEIYLRRGIAWYHLGEFERARADFRHALEFQQSPDGRTKFWLGATYAQDGNYWEAIHFYSEALRENPEFKPAYNNRALAYQQVGEFRRAAKDFEELLRRNHADEIARQRRDDAVQRAEQQGQ